MFTKKILITNVHKSLMHISSQLEVAQILISRRMHNVGVCIHKTECLSAIRRSKILINTKTWTNPTAIVLNEGNQAWKECRLYDS
jgi:hypothetical protein